MCAILDADVVGEVFGRNRSEAGEEFYKWITKGKGRLIASGKLLDELRVVTRFKEWQQQAKLAGRLIEKDINEVNEKAQYLENMQACESGDYHVIALAQVSGARLLYSNDAALQEDFKSKRLIDKPRGKVYSTRENKKAPNQKDPKKFTSAKKQLLNNKGLCSPEK